MVNSKKTGFVSLIGRPSSGKSTLVNTICGHKVSIVSDRPQTTQFLIRGIYNDSESQIIFIDTPGYHHFDSSLNRSLSNLSIRNLEEGDLILVKGSQSIRTERIVEEIMAEPERAEELLVRQEKVWKDKA